VATLLSLVYSSPSQTITILLASEFSECLSIPGLRQLYAWLVNLTSRTYILHLSLKMYQSLISRKSHFANFSTAMNPKPSVYSIFAQLPDSFILTCSTIPRVVRFGGAPAISVSSDAIVSLIQQWRKSFSISLLAGLECLIVGG
jgi:hypothetical protein